MRTCICVNIANPKLFQSLPWITGCQFDQSPIIAIVQIWKRRRLKKKKKTAETRARLEIKKGRWKPQKIDIKEEKMPNDG